MDLTFSPSLSIFSEMNKAPQTWGWVFCLAQDGASILPSQVTPEALLLEVGFQASSPEDGLETVFPLIF